ncbi:hypothetical protein BHE74_00005102 [Ensete ventricosum]|nr:hypothetical protein BHE74_00005102 [Ensete ventricosum]RZR80537.1 hypothetical protein BHM03_00006584 [Ensete ventricosum]
MAFWWPLVVLGVAFAVCRLVFMLIPHNVPSIEVDASDDPIDSVLEDGSQTKENSYIYHYLWPRLSDHLCALWTWY